MPEEREQNERGQSASGEREAQQTKQNKHRMILERALDETLAESFPASDPPSTIPAPVDEELDAA